MTPETRMRVNTPSVTHETIEGESVIINLETGNYYSLQGIGSEIWMSLAANAPIGSIVDDLCRHYEGQRREIEQHAFQLIGELQSEQLVVEDGVAGSEKSERNVAKSSSISLPQKSKFETPLLQKFTDMQDLLLLDPIHEVDAAGWPRAKQDN
jgi:hypothetical protein